MTGFLSKFWFHFIHSNFLVYNICWEDSDIDRHLLQINSESSLFTITSAGCNVLNYLLDNPKSVHCVDINPKQTALLELKVALIKNGDFQLFFEFFGMGKTHNYKTGYLTIKEFLSPASQKFWDKHIDYFHPDGKGLFYHGGSGLFARFLNGIVNRKGIRPLVEEIIQEPSKDRRAKLLVEINQKLWTGPDKVLWKSSFILSLAGIPESQRNAIGNINEFMQKVLWNVFVEQNPSENYYWGLYLEGSFKINCCPDYLKEENFELLRANIERLHISTGGIHHFLNQSKQSFTHLVLLDYMDWLVENNQLQLQKDWEHILYQSKRGTKILFRTAYPNANFLPDFVPENINLRQVDMDWIQQHDRVGTYTRTWLGEV